MPAELIKFFLSKKSISSEIQMKLILNSAPVLKNVKASCMFIVPTGQEKQICALLYGTGIKMFILYRNDRITELFIYREAALEEYINEADNRCFLESKGYRSFTNVKNDLMLLGMHMKDYFDKNREFPHEAGVFLGYPLEDVKGFVKHEGQNFSFCGYWKVYSNVDAAKQSFSAFDRAKDQCLAEFVSGKGISEIAC